MISRARQLAAAALGGALLLLPAFTGIANAAPASKVFGVTLARTATDMKKVADYWRPDRLKQADSYSPATPGAQAAPTSSAGAVSGPNSPATAVRRTSATQDVVPVPPKQGGAGKTMGKVFFRFGTKEYWCSASAVAARNRSVVATAGHCAYDSRQAKAAEYWIFVPNPGPNGETPDGIYVGAALSLHEDWPGKGDYDYDYAFVTVHRGFVWEQAKDGTYTMKDVGRLQDNVGAQGLEINRKPAAYTVAAFGFPAGAQPDGTRPFDGRTLRTCQGGVTYWTVAPALDLQKGVRLQPCDFSPGASGGPWLVDYDAARRLGNLNGVNSLTWNRDAKGAYDAVSSPYFDTTTAEVYRRAAAITTPGNVA
ncbi:trypsin-like serine peptidase [Nonomuraea sp. NPDC052265]|uniref:trypsin-like serine peptidase n=1 Tax=Nonomuraea sp. NPDC052265 TaxID=3364374 RepID=UPI0037CAC9B7